MNANDPFEEFEFKPITEGLGFTNSHRKNNTQSLESRLAAKESDSLVTPSRRLEEQIKPSLRMPMGMEPSSEVIEAPAELDKNSNRKKDSHKVEEILSSLKKRQVDLKVDFIDNKVNSGALYRPCSPDFSALILDTMLVVAMGLTCLIVMILITEADVIQVVIQGSQQVLLGIGLGLMTFLTWSYLVLTRLFMGFTPGEWVFDQRLFLPEEEKKFSSRIKLLWRATLVVMTGWVLLPFLSLIFRKDLAAALSGARLYRRNF